MAPWQSSDEAVLSLGRWQCTALVLGIGVLMALVFVAGLKVGEQRGADHSVAVASLVPPAAPMELGPRSPRSRSKALSSVSPGTRSVDSDLTRPHKMFVSRDPTDAARIETHRQLAATRALGIAGIDGPTGAPDVLVTPNAVPSAQVGNESGFALQVSVFEEERTAKLVAGELVSSQQPARVRRVVSAGRTLFRVEVGRFDTPAQASVFQRDFERASGYSTVLVALR